MSLLSRNDDSVPLLQDAEETPSGLLGVTPEASPDSVAAGPASRPQHSPLDLAPSDTSPDIDRTTPENATFGRNLGWLHVYSLIVSRIIGSGIFATPGSIYRSVGSVGLSLALWVIGAVIAACGLTVSLEYGCLLPRSGGEKVR
ncbi:hypothetical protein ABW19_dt0203873 [Dactylella cylindrospora]|nr:hypothetical protein ABW19_dt0203873 [Dactylella cylindrospora]